MSEKILGTDRWLPIEKVDFSDFEVIRIDTRDFHCLECSKHLIKTSARLHDIPLTKYPERFTRPVEGLKEWLLDFREMCGGVNDWRSLYFNLDNGGGWSMKYINIINYGGKIVITNNDNKCLKWAELIESNLNKDSLHAYSHKKQ